MEPKKLSNGKWQVRFRDLDKRQRAKSFEKKKDAEDFIIGLKHELKSGTYLDARAGDVALDQFWPVFIALKAGKKESTVSDYESMWKVHIAPRWGRTPVSRFKQDPFDAWILSLGLSARRTNKVHLLASMVFDRAVAAGNLRANPLKDANGKRRTENLPRIPKKEIGQVHTLAELLTIAKCSGQFSDYILVLGLCGLRWGEFVALQVKDLDLEHGTLWIHQSISEVNGKLVHSDTTKTHDDRLVYLLDFLKEKAPSWVEGKLPEDLLFPSLEGKILRNSNFTRRVYQPAMAAAGVSKKRLHDLRWTMISISASEGIEQNIVREQVGHSKAYMTSAYTKVFAKDRHIGLEKLNTAVNEVHEKCTEADKHMLVDLENLANSPSIQAEIGIEQFEDYLRTEDYEFGALTN
jgi:integrase